MYTVSVLRRCSQEDESSAFISACLQTVEALAMIPAAELALRLYLQCAEV